MDLTIVIGVVVVVAIAYFVLNKKSEDTTPTDVPPVDTTPVDTTPADSADTPRPPSP
jgi:hypothetical protein